MEMVGQLWAAPQSGGSVGQVSGGSRCPPRFERRLDASPHLLLKRSAGALGLLKKNQATKPLPEVELCPSPHRPTHRNPVPVLPVRTHTMTPRSLPPPNHAHHRQPPHDIISTMTVELRYNSQGYAVPCLVALRKIFEKTSFYD